MSFDDPRVCYFPRPAFSCLGDETVALLRGGAMLGSSSGALNFALSQNRAIVADLAAGNPTQAVRDALKTPWNPNPSDAQVQAALTDPQNSANVLLIIQRAGATPSQLKTIPQPGLVNYQSPVVTAALKALQAPSGTATPSLPAAPPPPAPPAATATTTTSTSTASSPPTTSAGAPLTSDQLAQIVSGIQNSPGISSGVGSGSGSVVTGPATPPPGFTFGPDGVTLVPTGPSAGANGRAPAPLSTGPLDFLTAPLTIPVIGVTLPAGVVYGGALGLGWLAVKLLRGKAAASNG